jgi:hypothetical protein
MHCAEPQGLILHGYSFHEPGDSPTGWADLAEEQGFGSSAGLVACHAQERGEA